MCKYLATLFCVKCSCLSRVGHIRNTEELDEVEMEDSPQYRMMKETDNHRPKAPASSSTSAAESESAGQVISGTERLLVKIHDLMQTNARSKARVRREKDENERMMNDWMVAAAVIDRICFILIAIVFVGGSATVAALCIFSVV